MSELLETIIRAGGGADRWADIKSITAHQTVGGALWGLKQSAGVLDDARITVHPHEQWASHTPFTAPGRHTILTPGRVAVETDDTVVEELRDPRASFADHDLMTPWSRLQLAYFAGYAMWTYLTEPISFALPGVLTEEIEPWSENGESWRRLRVTYPAGIETHSRTQTVYADSDGLLRRRDYEVDIMGGAPSVQYISGHREISGVVVATTRTVYSRDPDNHPIQEPVIVSIELDDIQIG
ncbi:MAG: hypothetical protein QOH84_1399 [Kribbellaceae bacterium]|nr:hypothetical protein [Kribbellaceae bacterium]